MHVLMAVICEGARPRAGEFLELAIEDAAKNVFLEMDCRGCGCFCWISKETPDAVLTSRNLRRTIGASERFV